jgi:hypothetical protein
MKDQGSHHARRNGNETAPSPVRENAKGKHHQDGQYCDFDKDRNHGPAPACEAFSYRNMRPERSIFQPGSRTLLTYPSLELLRPAPLIVS